jgi:hypothetical protein
MYVDVCMYVMCVCDVCMYVVCVSQVTEVQSQWDRGDWNTDTYATAAPEMCTGTESHIRTGASHRTHTSWIMYVCMYV